MPRILLNGRFLTQPLSGVQRYGRELVRALDALAAARDPGIADLELEIAVPRAAELRDPPELRALRVRAIGALRGHVWEQLELAPHARRRADLLFCPGNSMPIGPLLGPTHAVATLHSLAPLLHPESYTRGFRVAQRVMSRWICARASRVIAVSAAERARIAARFPAAAARIRTVDNGGASSALLEASRASDGPALPTQRPYVLFAGGLAPLKNLGLVLRALEDVAGETPLDLVVVGARQRGLRGAPTPLPAGLRGRVHWLGRVDDRTLGRLYAHALCLAAPSRYESSGLPALEALACGCPVIATPLECVRERCADAALYCDPEDPRALAAQIARLLGDPALRGSLIERGRGRARAYSWEQTARATLAVCREVLALQQIRPGQQHPQHGHPDASVTSSQCTTVSRASGASSG